MEPARRLVPLVLALTSLASTAAAGVVTVSSGDGIDLSLDDASGAVVGLELSPWSVFEPSVVGGLYVRDRVTMLDVPATAVNLLPNASFELDDGDGIPDGWSFNPGNGATLTLEPDPYDGAQSAVIHDRSGGRLETRVVVQENQLYVVQAMVKGPAESYIYLYWYDSFGGFLYAEAGDRQTGSPDWAPVSFVVRAPERAAEAIVRIYSGSDADLTIDMARMYVAPPAAFAPLTGTVTGGGDSATLTGRVDALELDVEAVFTGAPDHIAIDVTLTDTSGGDRALEAGFIAPVLPRYWYDHIGDDDFITQLTYAQSFDYIYCGTRYTGSRCPAERSIFPFGAVSLGSDLGFALGYDVADGPQDVEFFYSNRTGQALTAAFRVGAAPEPVSAPNQARFSLVLFRFVAEDDGMRSALESYYRVSAADFSNRMPQVGGWLMWYSPWNITDPHDFGIAVHTRDNDVAADDALGILSYAYLGDFDYRLDLGDYPSEPTPADAVARLDFNANDPGADPGYVEPSRAVLVSSPHDPAGVPQMDIEISGSIPGSGWSADCAVNLDPDVSDRSGNGWASRFDQFQAIVDTAFTDATAAGATLDGVYFHSPRSSLEGVWNHRREHWETADYPLSFDPVTLTPALPEAFSRWEAARSFADQMAARGLTLLTRDLRAQNYWMTSEFHGLGQYVNWTNGEDHGDLLLWRSILGAKPLMLQLDGDYATLDMQHAVTVATLYGAFLTPNYDRGISEYYWDQPALVDRDRPLFRRYTKLWRLQAAAGWQPRQLASAPVPELRVERFGAGAGPLLFAVWNSGASFVPSPITIDLAALGIDPSEVRRVSELARGSVVPTMTNGTDLEILDLVEPDGGRLYRVHGAGAATPVKLYAVRRGDDVALSWTDGGRDFYEVLHGPSRDLSGAGLDLADGLTHDDLGAIGSGGSSFYAVE